MQVREKIIALETFHFQGQQILLKTSPRDGERPKDFLDLKRPPPTSLGEEIHAIGRLKRECSISEKKCSLKCW